MDPEGSSQISFSADGSRLLSESLILPQETGPGGDDLSISELSLSDRPRTLEKPFSLLASGVQGHSHIHQGDQEVEDQGTSGPVGRTEGERTASLAREEKLQGDIFVLRKLNASFALFNDALQDTDLANERTALQLEQTDALLNRYIDMLARSEDMSRLIFDEKWGGADEDEAMLERERIEQQEKIRRAAEEQLLAAKLEEARREQEQQELLEREKRKRDEQGKKERVGMRGSSRSVRGTRTPMQAMRGAVSRGAATGISSNQHRLSGATNPHLSRNSTTSRLPAVSGSVTRSNSTRGSSRGT